MPGALNVTLDFRSVSRAASAFAGITGATIETRIIMRTGERIILDALKTEAPVKTGALRDSITSRSSGPQGAGFYGLYYGEYVVHGTRPHIIMPSVKKALYWPGARHPVRRVNHPGTKPNDFVRRAVMKAEPALRTLMVENGRVMLRLIATRAGAA